MIKINLTFKISIILISIIVGFSLMYTFGWYMSPGSYSRAEVYEIRIPEDSLIMKIKNFKNLNPEYKVPESAYYQDHRERFYYHIYLYYPIEKKVVHTWTRGDKHESTFAFVATWSINSINRDYKEANGGFWWWKNRRDKRLFEERILNKLGLKIE